MYNINKSHQICLASSGTILVNEHLLAMPAAKLQEQRLDSFSSKTEISSDLPVSTGVGS